MDLNSQIQKAQELRKVSIQNSFTNKEEILEKAKYFKREGTPGNYKYYYTEEEYKKAKGGKEGKVFRKTAEDQRLSLIEKLIKQGFSPEEARQKVGEVDRTKDAVAEKKEKDDTMKKNLTPSNVDKLPPDELKKLSIKGVYADSKGTFYGFRRDTQNRVVCSFRYDKATPSGMRNSTSGIYMTQSDIKFD